MKFFPIYCLILLSLFTINKSSTFDSSIRNFLTGLFTTTIGETWKIDDKCLDSEFDFDVAQMVKAIKKFRTVFITGYLHKLVTNDIIVNCPIWDLVNLYHDTKKAIKSGRIYINAVLHLKKLIQIIKEVFQTPPTSFDLGVMFGKFINVLIYDKSENNFLFGNNLIVEKYMYSEEAVNEILNFENIDSEVKEVVKLLMPLDNENRLKSLSVIFSSLKEKLETNKIVQAIFRAFNGLLDKTNRSEDFKKGQKVLIVVSVLQSFVQDIGSSLKDKDFLTAGADIKNFLNVAIGSFIWNN